MNKLITINCKKKRQVNLGIQVLRTILCFWVVCFHYYSPKNKLYSNIIGKCFHIPTFILISFYFLFKTLNERNITRLKQRNERILIPYIIWPVITWIVNNLLFTLFKINRYKRYLSFYDLAVQLITGSKFYIRFWFHFNIIFSTNFLFIISLIFKNNFLFVVQILALIAYGIQYLDYNHYSYFSNYNCSISFTLGYIPEIFPMKVTGITFASMDIIEKLNNKKYKMILFSGTIVYYLFRFKIFAHIKGFIYSGIIKNICSSFLFIFFALLPINNIKNKTFIHLLNQCSSYTLGIYIIHAIIPGYLKNFSVLKNKDFITCIINYIISYFISLSGYQSLKNTKLKYLFN